VQRLFRPILQVRGKAATKIQRWWRRWYKIFMARQREMHWAATRLQSWWRMRQARKAYLEYVHAIEVLQKNAHGFYGRLLRQRRQKELQAYNKELCSSSFELGKVARDLYIFSKSWNEEIDRSRTLEVLLEYRRALRAVFLAATSKGVTTWAAVLTLPPHRWMELLRNAGVQGVPEEQLTRVYKQCNAFLSVSMSDKPIEFENEQVADSRSSNVALNLEEFVQTVVRVATLWAHTPAGINATTENLDEQRRSKSVNLEVSLKLRVFLDHHFSDWLRKPLFSDDAVIPVAMNNFGVVKKLTGCRPQVKQAYDKYADSRGELIGDCFIEMFTGSKIAGTTLSLERIIEAYAASATRTLSSYLATSDAKERYNSTAAVKQDYTLNFREFEQMLVRCALSAAAVGKLDFSGSISRLGRLIDGLAPPSIKRVKPSGFQD